MNDILNEIVAIQQAHMRLLNCSSVAEKPQVLRHIRFLEPAFNNFRNNLFCLMVLDVIYGKKPRGCLTLNVGFDWLDTTHAIIYAEKIENMKPVKNVQFLNYDSFNKKNRDFSFYNTPCIKTNVGEYKFFLSEEGMNTALSFLLFSQTYNKKWTEFVADMLFKTTEDIGEIMIPASILTNITGGNAFNKIKDYILDYKFPNGLFGYRNFENIPLDERYGHYIFNRIAEKMCIGNWQEIRENFLSLPSHEDSVASFVLNCLGVLNRKEREIKSNA